MIEVESDHLAKTAAVSLDAEAEKRSNKTVLNIYVTTLNQLNLKIKTKTEQHAQID